VSPVALEAVIGVITFVFSVAVSLVVAGMRWQKMQDKVDNIESDLKEIKGMFTMKLKE